jgi:hypothetical protein
VSFVVRMFLSSIVASVMNNGQKICATCESPDA